MTNAQRTLARADRSLTQLDELFGLFGERAPEHTYLSPEQIPEPQRALLHHERHMTVTLEKFHQTKVDLEVLDEIHVEPFYARKILLTDQSIGERSVIQYGIMRFDLRRVNAPVRELILEGEVPLGRILIENEVLRRISTHGLLGLSPTPEIQATISGPRQPQLTSDQQIFGRLATILCNESPAVDLLEMVTGLG